MASAQNPTKLTSEVAQTMYLHDPGDATIVANVAWVDMRDFEKLLVSAMLVSGTGVLTFRLLVSGSATGADTPVEVRAHATPTVADAGGDTLVLECTAEEIVALATATMVNPRYVSAELDCDDAGDIVAVTYLRAGGRQNLNLTADVIA